VTLVAGPTRLVPPPVDELVKVRSAAEMHAAVMAAAPASDVVVMAAAVADYTPASVAPDKIAKTDAPLTLSLVRTRDILAELGQLPSREAQRSPVLVGFAAETGDAVGKARQKRLRKRIDLIVANDISEPGAGFDVATNAVTIVGDADDEVVPLQSKDDVAGVILNRVEELLGTRSVTPVQA
jgi:phosphopantothenoylcysteine decarboxylase/phosphopantothenate--cysteine ligase